MSTPHIHDRSTYRKLQLARELVQIERHIIERTEPAAAHLAGMWTSSNTSTDHDVRAVYGEVADALTAKHAEYMAVFDPAGMVTDMLDLGDKAVRLIKLTQLHTPEHRYSDPDLYTGSLNETEYHHAYGEYPSLTKPRLAHFMVCTECGRIETEQMKELCVDEWSYVSSLWPCPTYQIIHPTEAK